MSSPVPRVRIAPSPTGDPHIGTAYQALFDFVYARQTGGQFVLRIEDTDRVRYSADSEQRIFNALHWLGLTWDEGPDIGGPHAPYRQSERLPLYGEYARQLVANSHAYYCFCTPERLDAVRKAMEAAHLPAKYDRHCLRLTPAEVQARLAAGEPHVVRFHMPETGETAFEDLVRGTISFRNETQDDPVILKSDGFPTYHLAVVVDDHLMAITLVVRGEEWISSTPKHVALYSAFGWALPVFVHMPLLRNNDKNKTKISKRKNHTSLDWYREQGFLPGAMLNYLALQGWSMPDGRETFSLEEFIANFTWDRVSAGSPIFSIERLDDLNGQFIRALSPASFVEALQPYLPIHADATVLDKVVPLIQTRMNRLSEFSALAGFFFAEPDYPAALMGKVNGLLADPKQGAERAHALLRHGDTPLATLTASETQPLDLLLQASLADPISGPRDALRVLLVEPKLGAARSNALLHSAAAMLQETGCWNTESLDQRSRALAEAEGVKMRQLAHVMRVAITGSDQGPPLFESMEVLGKESCLARVTGAIQRL